jgi:F-type H+-transporting ATPase subunit alpha
MAWLVAFNDGLLDDRDLDTIGAGLDVLDAAIKHSSLELDSPRDEWSALVADALRKSKPEDQAA